MNDVICGILFLLVFIALAYYIIKETTVQKKETFMGMILDDKNLGIHCEVHTEWGLDLYTDLGHESLQIDWYQVQEAINLLTSALEYKRKKDESVPKSTT